MSILLAIELRIPQTKMYAILRGMRSVTAWKLADALVVALIALVIGLLFAWWIGAVVFLLGLAAVLRGKAKRTSSLSRSEPGPSDDESEWYYYRYGPHHGKTRKD